MNDTEKSCYAFSTTNLIGLISIGIFNVYILKKGKEAKEKVLKALFALAAFSTLLSSIIFCFAFDKPLVLIVTVITLVGLSLSQQEKHYETTNILFPILSLILF